MPAAQAQKELTHNEALARLDMLVAPRAEALLADPPTGPVPGTCWIVSAPATGDWAGREDALVCWTEGGWRFVTAQDGMAVYCADLPGWRVYRDGAWQASAAIALPGGGSIVDAEARQTLADLVAALAALGLAR